MSTPQHTHTKESQETEEKINKEIEHASYSACPRSYSSSKPLGDKGLEHNHVCAAVDQFKKN